VFAKNISVTCWSVICLLCTVDVLLLGSDRAGWHF